jgi:hypothetical protein
MRGKVGLVIGLAAGYVLGARAGRERYEQIKAQVDDVSNAAGASARAVKDAADEALEDISKAAADRNGA